MIAPNGMCVSCFQPTDTGMATVGEAEWHVAFLTRLGIPIDQAEATLREGTGAAPGMVMDGRYPVSWRVCRSCVHKVTDTVEPVLVIPGARLPAMVQL